MQIVSLSRDDATGYLRLVVISFCMISDHHQPEQKSLRAFCAGFFMSPKARFWVIHAVITAVLLVVVYALPSRAEPIYLSQNFDRGAADIFEQSLTDQTDTVILAVSGGYLAEGMQIGRIIREHGLRTVVPDGAKCLSACAEAFIGGVTLQIDGTVAFHVPRAESAVSRKQAFEQGLVGGTMTAIYRFEMGFGFELTQTINRWTTTDRLLAFENTAELLRYKNPQSGIKLPFFYER